MDAATGDGRVVETVQRSRPTRNARLQHEHGAASGSWILQLLAVLAVVGLLAYEGVAVAAVNVSVDDAGTEVARAARDAYRSHQSLERATEVAEDVAELRDVAVTAVRVDGTDLIVSLEKRASTLVLHRIGPLRDLTTADVTVRAALDPLAP